MWLPAGSGGGIGRLLYEAVEDYARVNGTSVLKLHSTLTARAFYSTLGFAEVEETEFKLVDGTCLPCILMQKQIE